MNVGAYAKALEQAEDLAGLMGEAYVVKHWEYDDDFTVCSLRVLTDVYDGRNSRSNIVASVDHKGIITESKWVLEQLREVAA